MPYPIKIITSSGVVSENILPDDEHDRMGMLQDIVGGPIEVVPLPGRRYLAFCEDGKLHAHVQNILATELAHEAESIAKSDYIAGDAVIVPVEALE